ncbi:MAG: T9SS type A sorting domain-containing protein [Bacteroidota bacterium]
MDNNIYTFLLGGGDCFNGCLVHKTWSIEVSEDCGTVQILSTGQQELLKFAIYPNPASNEINIAETSSEITTIRIYTVQGKRIRSLQSPSQSVDIADLRSGIYFLEVTTSEGNKQIQKFIKR